jgi:hypothetical protein
MHGTTLIKFHGTPLRVLGLAFELCLANRTATSAALPQ